MLQLQYTLNTGRTNASVAEDGPHEGVTAKGWVRDTPTAAQVFHVESEISESFVRLWKYLIRMGAVELCVCVHVCVCVCVCGERESVCMLLCITREGGRERCVCLLCKKEHK